LEVCGELHAPAALPPGKEPRYPLDRRLGGVQSHSGKYGEEKIYISIFFIKDISSSISDV
jgi:hypothetical protein